MRKNHPVARDALDELHAADAFLHVVRANGFTQAAKVLGRSTSSLSRAVSDLERHLGTQLLARTTRRMHLTEAGALYAAHAERLLAVQRAGHDAIAELTGGTPRGHLRVTMPVAVGERVLGPQIAALRKRYPELRLEIDLSDRTQPLVEGGFDLAIRVGRLPDSSLRAQLLGKVPVRLVAVGALAGPQEWPFHRRGARPRRIQIDGVVHTTSPALATQLAVSGLGLLRMVEWIIRPELRRGDLVPVMTDWSCDDPSIGGVPVYVVYAQTASATPPLKSRLFVEVVKQLVAQEGLHR